jgi:hypothetical protein
MDHSSNPNILPRRIVVPTDAGSPIMGYKDHSSNSDIGPRRMSVLPDAESHAMGYKDHSYRNVGLRLFSNRVTICTIEINLYPYVPWKISVLYQPP